MSNHVSWANSTYSVNGTAPFLMARLSNLGIFHDGWMMLQILCMEQAMAPTGSPPRTAHMLAQYCLHDGA